MGERRQREIGGRANPSVSVIVSRCRTRGNSQTAEGEREREIERHRSSERRGRKEEGLGAITAKEEIERYGGRARWRAKNRDGRKRKMTSVLSSWISACRAPLQANVARDIK